MAQNRPLQNIKIPKMNPLQNLNFYNGHGPPLQD